MAGSKIFISTVFETDASTPNAISQSTDKILCYEFDLWVFNVF